MSFVRLNPTSDLIYLHGQSRQEISLRYRRVYVVFVWTKKNHLMAAVPKFLAALGGRFLLFCSIVRPRCADAVPSLMVPRCVDDAHT